MKNLKITAFGRLGKDAETKEVNGTSVTNFSLGVNDTWKDKEGNNQEKTTWLECAIWGREKVGEYLKKGSHIYIEGEPSADAYNNKDGEAAGVLRVRVGDFKFLDPKKD